MLGWQEIPEDIRVVFDDPLEKCSAKVKSTFSKWPNVMLCDILRHTVCYRKWPDVCALWK